MLRDDQRHIPLAIRMDEPRRAFKKGGLAKHASKVKDAGRYGDDMLVHINKAEFEELRRAWGEPTINPTTGQPEYFLSGLRKWFSENPIASAVLPAAASIIMPGLGSTVGNFLNVGNVLGGAAGTVGNGLVGAGLGALTGGAQGALIGGASGALAPYVRDAASNLFSGFGGTGGTSGTGLRDSNMTDASGKTGGNAGGSSGSASSGWGGLSLGNLTSNPTSLLKAALALGAMGSAFHKPKDANVEAAQANVAAGQAQANKPLPQVDFQRQRIPLMQDPRRYGIDGPQQQFYSNNALPVTQAAEGGAMRSERTEYEQAHAKLRQADDARRGPARETPAMRQIREWRSMQAVDAGERTGYSQGGLGQAQSYVEGSGTGRSDEIPAMLSDGEYVIDAETVALLGDGSNKAGAQRLDAMRESIRSHKGGALSKGKFSPDAKDPMKYLGGSSGRK